jgi:hypothetical protein
MKGTIYIQIRVLVDALENTVTQMKSMSIKQLKQNEPLKLFNYEIVQFIVTVFPVLSCQLSFFHQCMYVLSLCYCSEYYLFHSVHLNVLLAAVPIFSSNKFVSYE